MAFTSRVYHTYKHVHACSTYYYDTNTETHTQSTLLVSMRSSVRAVVNRLHGKMHTCNTSWLCFQVTTAVTLRYNNGVVATCNGSVPFLT